MILLKYLEASALGSLIAACLAWKRFLLKYAYYSVQHTKYSLQRTQRVRR